MKFAKLTMVILLAASLSMSGCLGEDDNPTSPNTTLSTGKWLLTSVSIDNTELEYFDEYYLVFEEDGSGKQLNVDGDFGYSFTWSIEGNKVTFNYENRNPETKDFSVTSTKLTLEIVYTHGDFSEHFVETYTRQENNDLDTGTITGRVTDENTSNANIGATVKSDDGESATTDANGDYALTVMTGQRNLTVMMDGYVSTNRSVNVTAGNSYKENFVLEPVTAAGGVYSFVLTWGQLPSNLNCNMHFTTIEGITGTVMQGSGSADSSPYITISEDDFDGYGPESITIHRLFPSTYTFWIRNKSEEVQLSNSGAVLRIYNEEILLHTINIPNSGEGAFWKVCTFDGSTREFNIQNVIDNGF